MTLTMRRNWLLGGMVAAVLLLLAYAWIDGGERPLRNISEPVEVPVAVPDSGPEPRG